MVKYNLIAACPPITYINNISIFRDILRETLPEVSCRLSCQPPHCSACLCQVSRSLSQVYKVSFCKLRGQVLPTNLSRQQIAEGSGSVGKLKQ